MRGPSPRPPDPEVLTTAIRTALSGVRARCSSDPVDLLLATVEDRWRRSGASTSCSTRAYRQSGQVSMATDGRVKIAFLCPHLRIAGGVRAILLRRPARRARARCCGGGRSQGRGPALWRPDSRRAGVGAGLPGAHRLGESLASERAPRGRRGHRDAWQSAAAVRRGRPRAAAGSSTSCSTTRALSRTPEAWTKRIGCLRKIAISTWLRDVVRERFDSDADVLVTPVDERCSTRAGDVSGSQGREC